MTTEERYSIMANLMELDREIHNNNTKLEYYSKPTIEQMQERIKILELRESINNILEYLSE